MAATMNAIQYDAKSGSLQLVKLPIPVPQKNEVLVRVRYSGICGTDLHIIEGSFPVRETSPVTLGHEFSGVAHVVGEEVTNIAVGDNIAVDPNSGCGTCTPCHGGQYHFCNEGGINDTIGLFHDGGWSEFCAVPAVQVYKLPQNINLKQAALSEPLSCIAHGWDRVLPIPIGSNILILGAGIIGNLWASALHLQGHKRVTVSEPQEGRRKALQKLETNYEIITPQELKAKKKADSSWGVDLVIECSGFAPAIEEAIMLLRSGGTLCIFGVSPSEARISVSPFHLYKEELTIIGIKINPFTFNKALGWIDSMGDR